MTAHSGSGVLRLVCISASICCRSERGLPGRSGCKAEGRFGWSQIRPPREPATPKMGALRDSARILARYSASWWTAKTNALVAWRTTVHYDPLMTTRTATANGLTKQDANYRARIERYLGDIKSIHQDIVRKRVEGRKTKARIDRNLKEIQAAIDRVEATL